MRAAASSVVRQIGMKSSRPLSYMIFLTSGGGATTIKAQSCWRSCRKAWTRMLSPKPSIPVSNARSTITGRASPHQMVKCLAERGRCIRAELTSQRNDCGTRRITDLNIESHRISTLLRLSRCRGGWVRFKERRKAPIRCPGGPSCPGPHPFSSPVRRIGAAGRHGSRRGVESPTAIDLHGIVARQIMGLTSRASNRRDAIRRPLRDPGPRGRRAPATASVGRGCGLEVGLLDLQVDLLAVDLDLRGGLDTDPDLVAGDDEDGHLDVVADHDAFTDTAAEN